MVLGFFAYRLPTTTLVRIKADGLISGQAPHDHIMGGFWKLPMLRIADLLKDGRIQLEYAQYEMSLTETGEYQTSQDAYKAANSDRLRKRKLQCLSEIKDIKESLASKQKELEEIVTQQKELWVLSP